MIISHWREPVVTVPLVEARGLDTLAVPEEERPAE